MPLLASYGFEIAFICTTDTSSGHGGLVEGIIFLEWATESVSLRLLNYIRKHKVNLCMSETVDM